MRVSNREIVSECLLWVGACSTLTNTSTRFAYNYRKDETVHHMLCPTWPTIARISIKIALHSNLTGLTSKYYFHVLQHWSPRALQKTWSPRASQKTILCNQNESGCVVPIFCVEYIHLFNSQIETTQKWGDFLHISALVQRHRMSFFQKLAISMPV